MPTAFRLRIEFLLVLALLVPTTLPAQSSPGVITADVLGFEYDDFGRVRGSLTDGSPLKLIVGARGMQATGTLQCTNTGCFDRGFDGGTISARHAMVLRMRRPVRDGETVEWVVGGRAEGTVEVTALPPVLPLFKYRANVTGTATCISTGPGEAVCDLNVTVNGRIVNGGHSWPKARLNLNLMGSLGWTDLNTSDPGVAFGDLGGSGQATFISNENPFP